MNRLNQQEKHDDRADDARLPDVFAPPSMAVAIDGDVWKQMVMYIPAPACETERLHRLVYHALKAIAASTRSRLHTGMFCLPADGNETTPLWHQLIVELREGTVHVTF